MRLCTSGQWRAKAAWRPLLRLMRLPADDLSIILGDAVTETSHRVLAQVCDGDPQPLFDAILDPAADEFARSSLFETLAMLGVAGVIQRHRAALFLRDAFRDLQPQSESHVWYGWQKAIAILDLAELRSLVRKAFDRRYIGRMTCRFEDFLEDLEAPTDTPDALASWTGGSFQPLDDAVGELDGWSLFEPPGQAPDPRPAPWSALADGRLDLNPRPQTNPLRHVGRNDPCPCGSGRKYKKCCLA